MSFSSQDYIKVFLSFVFFGKEMHLLVNILGKDSEEKFERVFEVTSSGVIQIECLSFVEELKNKYINSKMYVGWLLGHEKQYASLMNESKKLPLEKNIEYLSCTVDDLWVIFSKKDILEKINLAISGIGDGFIFSSFSILYYCILSFAPRKKSTLYILHHVDTCTICIFDSNKLLYGDFFHIKVDMSIDDFGEERLNGKELFTYLRIKNFICNFYKTSLCIDSFLEEIIVFDSSDINLELLSVLEEELFLNATLLKINPLECVYSLTKAQVD